MKTFTRRFIFCAAATVLAAGCSLGNPDAPTPAGPSTYFVSLAVTASPDILPEDGVSQSLIKVVARDGNGQPIRDVQLRIDAMEGGRIVEFGTLSTRNVQTNAAGEATVIFTAPRAAIPGFDAGTIVEIVATPIGTDFSGNNPRGVKIRLVPQTVATIPGAPTPSFVFTPSNPRPLTLVTYNGSASTDADGTIVTYRWTFSDGHIETGPVVSHDFTAVGTYFVTLTVTDNQGKSASLTKAVTVS